MSIRCSRLDPLLGWMPAIPIPFWYRGWRTLFRERPSCYECRIIFKNEAAYNVHWLDKHLPAEEASDVRSR